MCNSADGENYEARVLVEERGIPTSPKRGRLLDASVSRLVFITTMTSIIIIVIIFSIISIIIIIINISCVICVIIMIIITAEKVDVVWSWVVDLASSETLSARRAFGARGFSGQLAGKHS